MCFIIILVFIDIYRNLDIFARSNYNTYVKICCMSLNPNISFTSLGFFFLSFYLHLSFSLSLYFSPTSHSYIFQFGFDHLYIQPPVTHETFVPASIFFSQLDQPSVNMFLYDSLSHICFLIASFSHFFCFSIFSFFLTFVCYSCKIFSSRQTNYSFFVERHLLYFRILSIFLVYCVLSMCLYVFDSFSYGVF